MNISINSGNVVTINGKTFTSKGGSLIIQGDNITCPPDFFSFFPQRCTASSET